MDYLLILLFLASGPILPLFATLVFLYAKYRLAKVDAAAGVTGSEVAQRILQSEGVAGVTVEQGHEIMGNSYDPSGRKISLTKDVFGGKSVYALAVAAHECGHAQQHHTGYRFMVWWVGVAPIAHFLAFGLQVLGVIATAYFKPLIWVVAFGFVIVFLMSVLSLPNEIDASRRAMVSLDKAGLIASPEERKKMRTVLIAAACTYVAKAVADFFLAVLWFVRARSANR